MDAPKPIPTSPTHCRGCGVLLEPLRRYGGLCKACVPSAALGRLADPMARKWTVIERFKRSRSTCNGPITERCVRVRCVCGSERVMTVAIWSCRRSLGCKRCRMNDLRRQGGSDAF